MPPSPTHPLTLTATGHRPNKLGGYNTISLKRLRLTAERVIDYMQSEHPDQPLTIISGMALGWDMAIALAALNANLPLIAAIPFSNQPSYWPSKEVQQWAEIKSRATAVHIISPNPTTKQEAVQFLQLRNEWMIDRGDIIIALFNGGKGGTANAIKYARAVRKPIINFWETYKQETL